MPRPVRPTRFGADAAGRSPGVLEGYQTAVSPRIDRDLVKRNLKDYDITLEQVQGTSDQQKYDMAARAVIKKFKGTQDKPDGKPGGGKPGGQKPRPGGRPQRRPDPQPRRRPARQKPKPEPQKQKPKPKPKLDTVKKIKDRLDRGRVPKVVIKPKPKPKVKTIKDIKANIARGKPRVIPPRPVPNTPRPRHE